MPHSRAQWNSPFWQATPETRLCALISFRLYETFPTFQLATKKKYWLYLHLSYYYSSKPGGRHLWHQIIVRGLCAFFNLEPSFIEAIIMSTSTLPMLIRTCNI